MHALFLLSCAHSSPPYPWSFPAVFSLISDRSLFVLMLHVFYYPLLISLPHLSLSFSLLWSLLQFHDLYKHTQCYLNLEMNWNKLLSDCAVYQIVQVRRRWHRAQLVPSHPFFLRLHSLPSVFTLHRETIGVTSGLWDTNNLLFQSISLKTIPRNRTPCLAALPLSDSSVYRTHC